MKIKNSQELEHIASVFQKTPTEISNLIIEKGIKGNVFADDQIDYGKTIAQLCNECGYSSFAFMVYTFTRGNSIRILNAFKQLVLMGEGDCPECGSNMKVSIDVSNEKQFMEQYCPNCNYVPSTNIDVDSMHGGHDDY